jgi:hypothetical protein
MNCHIVGVNECVSGCNKLCVFNCLFTFGEFTNTPWLVTQVVSSVYKKQGQKHVEMQVLL